MPTVAGQRAAFLALTLLGALGGCANLDVKKVPLAQRAAGCDHEQGFRYYLNRPYIVVKNPILICEMRSLVRVNQPPQDDPTMPGKPPGSGRMLPAQVPLA